MAEHRQLFYKSFRIIRAVNIQGRAAFRNYTGFEMIQFPDVLFQFFGELTHLDTHRAGPFTGPAIGATAGTMIGPEKMKGSDIRFIQTFAYPLGFGFIDKTIRAITKRAGIAAGITADTRGQKVLKVLPAGLGIQGLNRPDVLVTIHMGLFGNRIGQ
jgi:hypothetical protein